MRNNHDKEWNEKRLSALLKSQRLDLPRASEDLEERIICAIKVQRAGSVPWRQGAAWLHRAAENWRFAGYAIALGAIAAVLATGLWHKAQRDEARDVAAVVAHMAQANEVLALSIDYSRGYDDSILTKDVDNILGTY